jgi:drug/metabolite transporter (DMT)-like permease
MSIIGYRKALSLGNNGRIEAVVNAMPSDKAHRHGPLPWLALFTVYLVWGSTYLAIRVVVRELPPFAAAGMRFLTAGVVMAALAAFKDKARPSRRQLVDYALIGVLLLGFGNGLVMWAEQQIPSGIAALLVATVPLFITFLDRFRRGGEPWTMRVWAGTVIGLAGVVLVARPEGDVAHQHWGGIVALQFATFSWAVGSLWSQATPRRLPVFTAAAIEMLAGAMALGIESSLAGEDLSLVPAASLTAWGALGYLVVFGSLVAFTAFAYCLHELPASTVGTYAYVNPVVAVALGALLLHEPVSLGLLAGAALILVAVLLTTLKGRSSASSPRAGDEPIAVVEEA